MLTLIEIINKLNSHYEAKDTFEAEAALILLVSVVNPDTKLIEEARKELIKLLGKTDNKKDGMSLAEIAYESLLVLAELRPINDKDPISQDCIEVDDRVVISTGQQFSLTNLIAYHNSRVYKANHLKEFTDSKWLLNPFTNQPFDSIDVEHIKKMALKREEQLIDNLVLNYDKFDTLSLTESVALIRKKMRIKNLKSKEDRVNDLYDVLPGEVHHENVGLSELEQRDDFIERLTNLGTGRSSLTISWSVKPSDSAFVNPESLALTAHSDGAEFEFTPLFAAPIDLGPTFHLGRLNLAANPNRFFVEPAPRALLVDEIDNVFGMRGN